MKKIFITKNRILPFVQISMSAIYIMFWVLKLIWWSPASELVFLSTPFVNFDRFYPLLGLWEVLLGLSFLHLKTFKRYIFPLFIMHMIWTFIPFITTPELCLETCEQWFRHPTFTIVGQYIVKNLSLIACWLILKYSSFSDNKNHENQTKK